MSEGAPAPAAPVAAPEPTSGAAFLATNQEPAPTTPEPAQTVQPTQTEPVQTAPPQTESKPWYDGVHEDHVGFFEVKNFSDLNAIAKSYKNLESMRGVPENELLRIPKAEDAEAVGKMYDRLGRPATPQDYNFEGLSDDGEWYRELAHKNGLNERQATDILAGYNEQLSAAQEVADEQYKQKTQSDMNELKREWGNEFAANGEFAQIAARKFGIDDEMLDVMEREWGTKKMMNHLAILGRSTSEGSFAEGSDPDLSGGDLGMTPAAATEKRNALKADPDWKARYLSKDPNIRKAAQDELSRLSKLAFDQASG